MFDEGAGVQVGYGLPYLFLRVHHDGAVPGYWLLDWLTGEQQKADALVAGLNGDFVTPIEHHQRVVADVVHRRAARIKGLPGSNRATLRQLADWATASEHVGKPDA